MTSPARLVDRALRRKEAAAQKQRETLQEVAARADGMLGDLRTRISLLALACQRGALDADHQVQAALSAVDQTRATVRELVDA